MPLAKHVNIQHLYSISTFISTQNTNILSFLLHSNFLQIRPLPDKRSWVSLWAQVPDLTRVLLSGDCAHLLIQQHHYSNFIISIFLFPNKAFEKCLPDSDISLVGLCDSGCSELEASMCVSVNVLVGSQDRY